MSVRNHKKLQLTPLAAAFLAAGFMLPQQSFAQDDAVEVPVADEEFLEEVVVTGSRIRRADNLSSPTPMVTL